MSKLHWREKVVKSCPPGPPDCPVDHLVGPPGPVDHLVGPPGPVVLCENFPLGRKSSLESFQAKTFTKNSLGHSYVRMQQGCTNMRLTGGKITSQVSWIQASGIFPIEFTTSTAFPNHVAKPPSSSSISRVGPTTILIIILIQNTITIILNIILIPIPESWCT